MKHIAYLFAGQGAEALPDVARLMGHLPGVRQLLEQAGDVCRVDVGRVLGRGGRELGWTRVVQPVMTGLALGIAGELRRSGVEPALCAGHSLGEIAAWSATGAIRAEEAVEVAAVRGLLMEREAKRHPGGMLALVGTDRPEGALEVGRTHGTLVPAAHNAPHEWVLSGERAAVTAVLGRFRSVQLPVQGAWHSPLMAGAMGELELLLEGAAQVVPRARLVANRTGLVVDHPESIPALLAEQLIHPVEWVRTLQTLAANAVTHYVTVGPGKVLKSLLKRTLGTRLRWLGTDTPAELDSAIRELAG